MRPMRRTDRQVADEAGIRAILDRCQVCRLALGLQAVGPARDRQAGPLDSEGRAFVIFDFKVTRTQRFVGFENPITGLCAGG